MATDLSAPDHRLPEWSEVLVERGLASEAVQLLDRALSVRPSDPELRVALVDAKWGAGDAEGTVEATQAALDFARGDAMRSQLLAVRSMAELSLGRHEGASVSASEAARITPNDPLALFSLSVAQSASGRSAEARTTASSLIEGYPELPHGHVAMAAAASEQFEFESHVRRALEIAPDDEQLPVWLGAVLVEQGRNREALDVLSYATARHPESVTSGRLALRAAAQLQGRLFARLAMGLWLVGWYVSSASEGYRWVGWVSVAASALLMLSERLRRRRMLGPHLDRVITREVRRGFRGTGALILQAVGAFIAAMVGFWVLIFAIPATGEDWATIHGWHYLIAGLIATLGVWMFLKGREVRRVGRSVIREYMWRCRCRDLAVVTGGDVRRYTAHHLWSTVGGSYPMAYTCPETGAVWIQYEARLGKGGHVDRLVRLPSVEEEPAWEEAGPPVEG